MHACKYLGASVYMFSNSEGHRLPLLTNCQVSTTSLIRYSGVSTTNKVKIQEQQQQNEYNGHEYNMKC